MRKLICLVALALLVLSACVEPPPEEPLQSEIFWGANQAESADPATHEGGGQATTGEGAPAQAGPPEEVPAPGGIGNWMWIAIYAAIFGAFFMFVIRPQRKRDKKMKEIQASLCVGDSVVTTGGLYGRIAEVCEECFVVECGTNRGVRIPVRKSDVLAADFPKTTPVPKE